MKLKTSTRGGVTVLTLDGNLMGGPDATALNARLHELIEGGKKQIVLDLSRVSIMNSSGLGLLIGGVSAVKNAGGRLTIAAAGPKVSSVITVTRLEGVLERYPTVDAAVASYTS